MTYREQRRGQWVALHVMGIGYAMTAVGVVYTGPWLLPILWLGWEMILWCARGHQCWRDDIELDALVPLDTDGRPLH